MKTTVDILCMTCCERLSATDDVGGEEARVLVEDMASEAGWVRVERKPKHVADVCAECASLISEKWKAIVGAEVDKLRTHASRMLNFATPPLSEEEFAQFIAVSENSGTGDPQ